MKGNCEIIQDLLPLYYDQVCSRSSSEMVEEHLVECEECQKYLQVLKTDLVEPMVMMDELEKTEPLKKIRKQLNFKYIKIGIFSTTLAFIVFLGGMWGYQEVFYQPIPVPYGVGEFTVHTHDDGTIDIFVDVPEHIQSITSREVTRVVNGIEKTVIYFQLNETRWTRWNPSEEKERIELSDIWNLNDEDNEREIAAIYYFKGNFRSEMTDEDLLANSVLIWEP